MWEDFYLGNKAKWETCNTDTMVVKEVSSQFGIPELLSEILIKRGLCDPEQMRSFLRPSVKGLNNPRRLPDMDKAVQRILKAKEKNERVIIYGDYDVDGVTATSILFDFLQSMRMDVSFYIPSRADEGYGISELAIDYLTENHFDLMITVDCGINAMERVADIRKRLLNQNRTMDIIITDHHRPGLDNLPTAEAILNPHLSHSQYPFRHLCGAGISFKLVQALCVSLNLGERFLDYVDLAALGTVADIVSLTGENRIIVWAGLKKMKRCPNLGIKALMKVSGMHYGEVDSRKVAFLLAPRVNAAGRMGDAGRGVMLFTTQDEQEAESIAMTLQQDNSKRQKIQEEIFEKALKIIESDPRYYEEKVMVVAGENWHHGVIGIVASKLNARFNKPCFVLSVSGDLATGSARSIVGFNIFSAMTYCGEFFLKYGGHELAGGLTMSIDKLEDLRKEMNRFASENLSDDDMVPKVKVDAEADIKQISLNTAEVVMAMEPFGEGNPVPLFRLNHMPILEKKRIGASGDHLKLILGTRSHSMQAIAFNMGQLEPFLPLQDKVDLVFSMGINEYMGRRNLQLVIQAIRLPETSIQRNRFFVKAVEIVESLDYSEDWIYNGINHHKVSFEDIRISREDLGVLYRHLQKVGSRSFSRSELFLLTEEISRSGTKMNYFKLMSGLFVLDELDIIRFTDTEKEKYKLKIPEKNVKASLENSMLYSFLHKMRKEK